MTARLQGRTALVTGATDGLGAGIARVLADEGRMGTPEGVGQAVAFLASDEASTINGATLSVDGGLSAT